MLVGTTPDGGGDRIGPRRPRSDVRLLREGGSQKALTQRPTRTTEPGSRDDHADTDRHLAPGATQLPGAAPVTAEIA